MTVEEMVYMYQSGNMVKDVANASGLSYSTVWRRLKEAGALRGKKESMRLSIEQGRFSKARLGKKRGPLSDETKRKISEARRGTGRGWRVTSTGYIEMTTGENAGRGQHVIVMEEMIGRRLMANECIHHKNHIKTDNRPENLEIMTRSEHARLHAEENHIFRNRNERGQFK